MKKFFGICMIAFVATSCTKSFELAAPEPDSKDTLTVLISFLEKNAKKYVYPSNSLACEWTATKVEMDGVSVQYRSTLRYTFDKDRYYSDSYPSITRTGVGPKIWGYTIGDRMNVLCPAGTTIDMFIEVEIILDNSMRFTWKRCPVRIYVQDGGTPPTENERPSKISVYVRSKNSTNGS